MRKEQKVYVKFGKLRDREISIIGLTFSYIYSRKSIDKA